MKDKILNLRLEGKSYNEIVNILKCSKSLVAYYCGNNQKEKTKERVKKFRDSDPILKKVDNFKNSKKRLNDACKDFQSRKGDNKRTFSRKDILNKFGDNPKCYLTGRSIDWNDGTTFSFDHIIPVYLGGDNSLENLGLTCVDANNAKHKLTVDDFLSLCKEVLEYNGYVVSKQ